MKNIKGREEEAYYDSSREEKIKSKFAGSKYDDYDSNHYFYSYKKLSHWVNRFLQKHVGKSYNKTYSEFLSTVKANKDFPAVMDKATPADIFKGYFKEPYNNFTVVNGVIKEVPKWWHKEKTKYIYEYPEGHKYRYTLSSKLKSNQAFCEIIISTMGYAFLERLKKMLTEEEMNSLKNRLLKSYKYAILYNHTINRREGSYTDIFERFDIAPKIKVEYTDAMKKKKHYENEDARNKERREWLAEREEKISTLLHDLEEKKKRLEEEKNRIDMERLGFDNNSFKGEPYHGQKRKKNKVK